MKKTRKPLLLLALLLVGALLFSSVPALAGDNRGGGRSLAEARQALEQRLMSVPGFVGIAHSEEHGEIVVFLENPQAKALASSRFEGFSVRTEVTGVFRTHAVQLAEPEAPRQVDHTIPTRTGIVRPLMGGTSVSAYVPGQSWAGTLGMVTYDSRILSNAHVIAMDLANNFLAPGTPIIQPARGDGGGPANRVGELEGYIPIDFSNGAVNYADAAIASIDPGVDGLSGWQFGAGSDYRVSGTTTVAVGDTVRKSGRTTGVTTGEVAHTNSAAWVDYDGQLAYFVDQILVTGSFSRRGDSGSVVDKGGAFVGLVFAGNDDYSVVCKASYIIGGLGIAVEPTEVHHPQITVSPTSFDVTLTPGAIWIDTLAIGNTGDADLTYHVSDGGYPWLSQSPTSGSVAPGGSHSVTVAINTMGLAPGTYTDEIVIASNDPDENSTTVPVTLHVSGLPTVTTKAATGVGTDSATLNMSYAPGGHSTVDVSFAYKRAAGAAWTETSWVTKTTAGTHAEPLIGLNSDTAYDFKARLKYNATVLEGSVLRFTTGSAEQPRITVAPTSFDVTLLPDTVWTDTLTISNTGDANLTYDITDGANLWLDVNPKSGSVAPGGSHSVTVAINTMGLAPGTYTDEIVIANNDPDNESLFVPVTLHVSDSDNDVEPPDHFLDNPPIEVGLASIADELVIVLLWRSATQTWDLYFPVTGEDTIGTLEAWRPYWIYVDAACTLEYGTVSISLYAGWNNEAWLRQ